MTSNGEPSFYDELRARGIDPDEPVTDGRPLPDPDNSDGYFIDSNNKTQRLVNRRDEFSTKWISDGYAFMDTILENYENPKSPDRIFIIKGRTIYTKADFEFSISAAEASETRRLKAALVNAFGLASIGSLNLHVIQKLSKSPNEIRVYNKPIWLEGKLIAPGLETNHNNNTQAQFRYAQKVAVSFEAEGDLETGLEALETIFEAWKDQSNIITLFAAIIGAPIIALLWPDDRFMIFLHGTTGTLKTTATTTLQALFGTKYSSEVYLVRWGDGATTNAIEHIAAKTGPFAYLIDNYKTYTDKDPAKFQRMVHALLEGTEKSRLDQNIELRPGEEYLCTPICTAENYPGQDAATRARIALLNWQSPDFLNKITEAQKHLTDLNALGKAWILWLSSEEGRDVLERVSSEFEERRYEYLEKAKGCLNSGRIASNATILSLIWELLGEWEVTEDLATKYTPVLEAALEDLISEAKQELQDHLDSSKFLSWLKAEIQLGRYVITNPPKEVVRLDPNYKEIGFYRLNDKDGIAELLITIEVFESILLPAWVKSNLGAISDKRSLLRQLKTFEYLRYDEGNQNYTLPRNYQGDKKRVYVFCYDKIFCDDSKDSSDFEESDSCGPKGKKDGGTGRTCFEDLHVPQNRYAEGSGTGRTGGTGKQEREFLERNLEESKNLTELDFRGSKMIDENKSENFSKTTRSIRSTRSTTDTDSLERVNDKIGTCGTGLAKDQPANMGSHPRRDEPSPPVDPKPTVSKIDVAEYVAAYQASMDETVRKIKEAKQKGLV